MPRKRVVKKRGKKKTPSLGKKIGGRVRPLVKKRRKRLKEAAREF